MVYRLLQVAECSGTLASAVSCPPFVSSKWGRRWNSCVIWVFSVGRAPGTVRKTTHVAPLLSVESDAFRVTLDFSWFLFKKFLGSSMINSCWSSRALGARAAGSAQFSSEDVEIDPLTTTTTRIQSGEAPRKKKHIFLRKTRMEKTKKEKDNI